LLTLSSTTYFLNVNAPKLVANNRKAYHDYEVLEKYETGIALTGSEVKSIRAGKINITEAYAQCHAGSLFVLNLHISPYERQGTYAPDPLRKRRLLLHKKEVGYLAAQVEQKRLTLVPLSMYFKNRWLKVELGLCRGRKKYDKREKVAAEETKRSLAHLRNLRNRP
jgi:SsrA-binding protein